jgi:putative oxidoreductase
VPSQTITSEPKNPTARWKTIGFRVLRFVFAIFLLMGAVGKLAGIQQMVQLFDAVGLGQWFRIFTGLCELATAILIVFPATIGVGALLGFFVMVGATIANIVVLHHDFIHSAIPAIIFAMIAWTYRGQLLKLIGLGDRQR